MTNEQGRRRRPTRYILIVLGVGLAAGGLSVALLVSQSSLQVDTRGRHAAFAAMDAVRRRFGDAAPCVGLPSGQGAGGTSPPPATVHMLAWEREDDRFVRLSTPYWALRVAGWKVAFARTVAPALQHVSLPDIERCGRGLILDRQTAGGDRIVIWAD